MPEVRRPKAMPKKTARPKTGKKRPKSTPDGSIDKQVQAGADKKIEPRAIKLAEAVHSGHERIGIFGPGGVGKSTLLSLITETGRSLGVIDVENGCQRLGIPCFKAEDGTPPKTYEEVDAILDYVIQSDLDVLAMDTLTKFDKIVEEFVVRTVPKEDKGTISWVDSIEKYGWAKGYEHKMGVFERFLTKLDRVVESGTSVVLVCHDETVTETHTEGNDYLCTQPFLQATKNGNFRSRFLQWCDHLFYIGLEFEVNHKTKKAAGDGERFARGYRTPSIWAKSRFLDVDYDLEEGDPTFWSLVFGDTTLEEVQGEDE